MAHRDLLLANARVVLAERVNEAGWVAAVNGAVVEIGEGRAPDHAEDLAGDLLLPGLVELHTDHLEAHYVPRPKVHWDPVAAVVSYDGQLATCGITTALDSLRVWREEGAEDVDGQAEILADGKLRPDVIINNVGEAETAARKLVDTLYATGVFAG